MGGGLAAGDFFLLIDKRLLPNGPARLSHRPWSEVVE